jgi:DNA-binding transcriptional LysR family regulator
MTLGLLADFQNTAALRYFFEVAKYGSFRLTAEKIFIAASAISRQIQLLEQELGAKLFSRGRKGLQLTAAGEALLYRLKRAMNELSEARSEIDMLNGSHAGNVRVGINETIAREFFAEFLKEFRHRHPYLKFEILVANTDQLENALLNGELDIIVGYAVRARVGLQQVASFPLISCVTVRMDHPLAAKKFVRIADLVDQSFVLPSSESMLRELLDELFSRLTVKPASTLVTNSFEFMTSLVLARFGIGCQLRPTAGPDAIRPEIVYVPIKGSEIKPAVLACCISKDGVASMAVSICLQEIRQSLESWCKVVPSKPRQVRQDSDCVGADG